MAADTVLFLLGETFRWSLLGDNDGEENDEDSVINDLEYYLSNYEADWDGTGPATVLEHGKWEHIRRIVWVRRNSGSSRQLWLYEAEQGGPCRIIGLPKGTTDGDACWVIKAMMKPG